MIVLCREHFGLVKICFLISKEFLAVEECCVIAFLGFIRPVSLLSLCIFFFWLTGYELFVCLMVGHRTPPPQTLLIRICGGKNKVCHSSGGGRDPDRSAARAEKWGHREGVELNEIGEGGGFGFGKIYLFKIILT